ncbi:hypothetical protein H6G89_04455 [Oscillatoria sp. FACHB-1407]|uniref:hypothetical protein n=1 Tax=Oscillatoria sp. FACHB-1407 TaxID=2692847 RepID=UPI00168764E3|nr:hypothetical protein [Oscillatoria sp. FACHB-1407]MBD2460289.1 hypothetical protein [Oscillatoria sp. FACHB-1407]
MGTKVFSGNTDDTFAAYKEGGFLGFGSEWRSWYIDGAGGNDKLTGGEKNDTIIGGSGNDVLKGLGGADTLEGGADNDVLYGAGVNSYDYVADTLKGGTGHDVYYAETNDLVVEAANSGYDTLHLVGSFSYAQYSMAANVEELIIDGTGNLEIIANNLDNNIKVNTSWFYGTIDGGFGVDFMEGGQGFDQLRGGGDNDTLIGGGGGDGLFGDTGNDVITGVDFSGGTGVGTLDKLTGGAGADRFILGNASQAFYDDRISTTAGTNDYALITDFQSGVDKLVIHGPSFAYIVQQEHKLGASDLKDTLIFRDNGTRTPDLIAVLQDTTTLVQTDFVSY